VTVSSAAEVRLRVNEIFGPTIQGEGAATGRHCLFVRLSHCNLECTWCDTPYTWAWSKSKADKLQVPFTQPFDQQANSMRMTAEQVHHELQKLWDIVNDPTIIVISGGEPMIQQKALVPLLQDVTYWGNNIHIETAGTIQPDRLFDNYVGQYNVSPKLAHSGNSRAKRYKPEVLAQLAATTKSWFKFVMKDVSDFEEVDYIVNTCNIDHTHVMVMPEGKNEITLNLRAEKLIDEALKRGYGLSPRLHVTLWGHQRGK
jgi:7-carboxy-7-deazaguanine synthase